MREFWLALAGHVWLFFLLSLYTSLLMPLRYQMRDVIYCMYIVELASDNMIFRSDRLLSVRYLGEDP